jgi:hypothetical protein
MTEDIRTLSALVHARTAGRVGVTTYSPGDGETRYALGIGYEVDTPNLAPGYVHDYFGDRRIMSAVGAKAARTMLLGFLAGLDYSR